MSIRQIVFRSTALFLLTGWSVILFAQQEYLVLEKTMRSRQTVYSSGDDITFRLKGEDFFRTDHIIALNDTAIEFHYNSISYHEIDVVNTKNRPFPGLGPRKIGSMAQIVGLGYIAIDQFNQVVVRGEDPSYNDDVILVGGIIFAGGTVLKFLEPRKVHVGGKYRLRYMNISTN